jgi:hypothetical protein
MNCVTRAVGSMEHTALIEFLTGKPSGALCYMKNIGTLCSLEHQIIFNSVLSFMMHR